MRKALQQAVDRLHAGRADEAAALLEAVLDAFPSNPEALRLAGYVACREGRYKSGIDLLKRAIAGNPDDSDSHCYLASAFLRMGSLADAERSFRRALALDSRTAEAQYGLGETLRMRGGFVDAEEAYRRALTIDSDHWAAAAELANLYERANRLDEARRILADGLTKAPDYPLLNLLAAKFERRAGKPQDAVVRLVGLLRRNPAAAGFRRIHSELGRLYDRAGDAGSAFGAFQAANDLARDQWEAANPGPNQALLDAERLLARFTPDWVGTWRRTEADTSDAPIFLVGFPRSGTTLLDQILDAHSQIRVLEEQATIGVVENRLAAGAGGYPDGLASLRSRDVTRLTRLYHSTVEKHLGSGSSPLVVDKLPLNMARAGLIHRLFPAARFIFAVRHPCDAVLSCFMQNFGLNAAMANFLTVETTVRFYDVLMQLWQRYLDLFSLKVHVVRYEDVVEDTTREARRLAQFLGVEYEPAMTRFHEHARQRGWISTPSYHQVSQPVYGNAVNRWERYRNYLEPSFDILRRHAQKYGYSL